MKRIFQRLFLCALLFVTIGAPSFAHAGIGVSPAGVVVNAALNEIPQKHTVKILRDYSVEKEVTIYVEYRGEYAKFISGPSEIFFPAGVDRVNFSFTLTPSQLPNGLYNAQIVFLPSLDDIADVGAEGGSAVSVRAGNTLGVSFTVSDEQVIAFDIQSLVARDIEVNMDLGVQFQMINIGNVSWRPDSVTFSVLDERGEIVYAETRAGSTLTFVSPGESVDEKVFLKTGLIPGSYILRADFSYDGKIVRTFDAPFSVLPEGTLPQSGILKTISTNKNSFIPGEGIKIIGVFENTGQVAYLGTFVAEIYREGTLVDVLVTDPQRVEVTDEVTFNLLTNLKEPGDYTINAYVEYGQKITDPLTKQITVISTGTGLSYLLPSIIGFLIFLVLLFLLRWILKRRKRPGIPVITGPVFVNTSKISGTSPNADTSVVEVLMNGLLIGSAVVKDRTWELPVAAGVLAAGNQLTALARVDLNHDRTMTKKDKTSKPSVPVMIEAAPVAPVTPSASVSLAPTPTQPVVSPAPVQTDRETPVPQASPTPVSPPEPPAEAVPITSQTSTEPQPTAGEASPPHDDLWTISL